MAETLTAPPRAPTRDRLLHAARELFTTVGYYATTTPMLSKRAGVAEGTIYRHFVSKQALLNASYQDIQRWGVRQIATASAEPTLPVEQRMGKLARQWLLCAETDSPRIRLLLGNQPPAELDADSLFACAEFRRTLEQLIARGKQEGSVRAGVVELWTAVWLALIAFAVEKVAAGTWTATHPHALATIDAAWEAIGKKS